MNSADFADTNARYCVKSLQCRQSCNSQLLPPEATLEWLQNSSVAGLSHRKGFVDSTHAVKVHSIKAKQGNLFMIHAIHNNIVEV